MLKPAIRSVPGVVIVAQRAVDVDGSYTDNLLTWIHRELGPEVEVFWPPQHRGIDVVVVTRAPTAGHTR